MVVLPDRKRTASVRSIDTAKVDSEWRIGGQIWRGVFGQTRDTRAFVSPEWVSSWLRVHGEALGTLQLVFTAERGVFGTCLVTSRDRGRLGFKWTRLYLNSDGETESDSVVVEHNRILALPGDEKLALEALSDWIERQSVDEFVVAGACEDERSRLLSSFRSWIPEVEQRSAPFVDLAELRAKGQSHLEAVSANTRAQLRRCKRAYEALGELQVRVAQTVQEALDFFQDMIVLHEQRWEERGFDGAFASAARKSFHLDFIRSAFDEGRVHLLRVLCGSDTIGILYNFHANGYVSFYQSGFDYPSDSRLKPGLLTHHMAIEHYRANSFLEYDFLASEEGQLQYKRSLCTSERPLFWVSLFRPSTKHQLLRCLRWFRRTRKHALASLTSATTNAKI